MALCRIADLARRLLSGSPHRYGCCCCHHEAQLIGPMNRTHTYRSSTRTQRVASAAAWLLVVVCALAGPAWAGEQAAQKHNNHEGKTAHHDKRSEYKYKDHVRVSGGPQTKLQPKSVAVPSEQVDKTGNKVSRVVTLQVIKGSNGKKQTRGEVARVLPRKRGDEGRPSRSRSPTYLRQLSRPLDSSQPAVLGVPPTHGNVISFAQIYARKHGHGPPPAPSRRHQPQRNQRKASKAPGPELVASGHEVFGHENGLPVYGISLTGQTHVLRGVGTFLSALGIGCMPKVHGNKLVVPGGTLVCLMLPGEKDSRHEGNRQRLVDSLEGRLLGLVDQGLVAEDAPRRAVKVLSHPEALVVGADGVIRVSPKAALILLKVAGWLGNGAADDHRYADSA